MVYPTLHSSAFPALRSSTGYKICRMAWQPGPVEREVLACATNQGGKICDLERRGAGVRNFGTNMPMKELTWSRDGLLFATLGDDQTKPKLVVWKSGGSRSITLQLNPQVDMDAFESIKFNDSGQLLSVCEFWDESFLHVFDAVTGVCLLTVEGHSLAWRNELEFYCGGDESIAHFKLGQDTPIQVLFTRWELGQLSFNQKSGILANYGVWNPQIEAVEGGVELWYPPEHSPAFIPTDEEVMSVRWHPHNSTLLAGSFYSPNGVIIWDTVTRTSLLHILDVIPTTMFHCDISFSPDGRFLAVANDRVSVRKVSTGEIVAQFWPNLVSPSSLPAILSVRNVCTGEIVAVCQTEGGEPTRVRWSPNGEKLAVNVQANSVSVFNLENIVTMNLKTLSMIRVAECLKMNNKNGPYDVEKLFREQNVPQIFVKEINEYLE